MIGSQGDNPYYKEGTKASDVGVPVADQATVRLAKDTANKEITEAQRDEIMKGGTQLRYPLEDDEGGAAEMRTFIHFFPKRISPPSVNSKVGMEIVKSLVNLRDQSGDADDEASGKKEEGVVDAGGSGAATGGNVVKSRAVTPTGDLITIFLPVSFTVQDGFGYDTPDLGIMGAGALAGLSDGGSSIMAQTFDALGNSVTSISDLFKGDMAADTGRLGAVRGAQRFLPQEIAAAGSVALAVTVNPNKRAVFRGVAVREFTFQFKFIPRNQQESLAVKGIIDMFRMYAYPEALFRDETNKVSPGYKYPNLFEIVPTFKHEDGSTSRIGTKIADCYLKAINTNYNASSMAFHEDGSPVEIDLTLSFTEERTLDRKDIRDGY